MRIYIPRHVVAQFPTPYACAKAAIEAVVERRHLIVERNNFDRPDAEITHDYNVVPCDTYVNKATEKAFRDIAGVYGLSETACRVFKHA